MNAELDAFVEGRSSAKAAELIEKAEAAGLSPSVVRTTRGGYIVPKELVEQPKAKHREDFDPADHTVAEVEDYFASADDAEIERVIEAEQAGKGRKGIVEYDKE